jgi:hypothetical protein
VRWRITSASESPATFGEEAVEGVTTRGLLGRQETFGYPAAARLGAHTELTGEAHWLKRFPELAQMKSDGSHTLCELSGLVPMPEVGLRAGRCEASGAGTAYGRINWHPQGGTSGSAALGRSLPLGHPASDRV